MERMENKEVLNRIRGGLVVSCQALCGEPLHMTFRQVDAIAAELQMDPAGSLRVWAGLLYALRHNAGNGHTCLPRPRLVEATARFLGVEPQKAEEELDLSLIHI